MFVISFPLFTSSVLGFPFLSMHILLIKKKKCFKITIYFIWFNVSRLLFVTVFIQCFKIIICFIWFKFLRIFLSLTYKKNSLHFYSPFSLLLLYIHMSITLHVIPSQIHLDKKRCHLPSTFQLHLYNSNILVSFDSNLYE